MVGDSVSLQNCVPVGISYHVALTLEVVFHVPTVAPTPHRGLLGQITLAIPPGSDALHFPLAGSDVWSSLGSLSNQTSTGICGIHPSKEGKEAS